MLKLIFANDDTFQEVNVRLSTEVRDLKQQIMQYYWPESQNVTPVDTVERLRLFAGGKELGGKEADDAKSLKDAKLMVAQNHPTPVHVQIVQRRSTEPAEKESVRPSQCFCAIL